MFWTTLKRIIRSGFVQFWRSSFVSLSSILIMIITLFSITTIIFSSAILQNALIEIKNKVDINVYFASVAEETEVLSVKTSLEKLPEVAQVEYLSRDQVLEIFRNRHQNDSTILQSLDEIGDNPLGAVLNIKAKQPDQYESIAQYLKDQNILSKNGIPAIEKINYYDNQVAIQTLTKIIKAIERFGFIIMILLVILSIIITFNTIRLAIYISREEISVMRLVGASNKYIRGPFVVIGMLYGVCAGIITLLITYPIALWIGRSTENFFVGLNVHTYFVSHFVQIFLIIIGSGIVIGAISSYLAVRKYLTT